MTRWTIINLDICLKVRDYQGDRTRSLTVQLNCSIPGKCSFLDTQFRDMPISAIFARSSSNFLSSCICMILKPCCRYILLTCLIPSSMSFTFQFLIILTVGNIMCWNMAFSNLMTLMVIRSHYRVNFLYISRITLGGFFTMIGSTWWILWQNFSP